MNAKATSTLPEGATACVYLGGLRHVADVDEAIAVNREAFALAGVDDPTKYLDADYWKTVTA